MRLKKLDLFGFKSFADKTEIFFDEGVTCVVGPNGCGKSNISDSIRWVLGERSAKLLRGSKMEDVIFNGTDLRKQIGLAEVSLTIDNADRGLPIDYQEVTLTRRLYRSGESEYLINKTICRLKDIQDLILDTGIGSNSYSMIEQGRIDYILNADADARRFLIEEAAGISKYKVKKEEAIRKLERTEENRLRLNDIIQEVNKNIQYAERQARKAERFKLEYEKLKSLELRKAFFDLAQLTEQETGLAAAREILENESGALESLLREARERHETLRKGAEAISERYRLAEAGRYQLQSQFEQNRQQLAFHQEKRVEMASRKAQIAQEKSQIDKRTQQNARDIEAKQAELLVLGSEKENAYDLLLISETALQEVEAELAQAKETLEKFRSEAFETASRSAHLRNSLHRLNAFLDTSSQQKKRQEAGASRLREESGQWKEKQASCRLEIGILGEKLARLNERRKTLQENLQTVKDGIENRRQEAQSFERRLQHAETRFVMLSEIDEAGRRGEQDLLEQNDAVGRALAQSLREIVRVHEGFEWALDAALDSFSRSLVAENLAAAEILIERVRHKNVSPIGILLRQSPQEAKSAERPSLEHPEIICALQKVVHIQPDFQSLLGPFIENVYIVRSLPAQTLLKEFLPFLQDYKLISEDGLSLGPAGRIFYRNSRLTAEDNPFKRAQEIQSLSAQISELKNSFQQSSLQVIGDSSQINEWALELEQLESERMDATVRKESFESVLNGLEDRLASFEREIQLNLFETEELRTREEESVTEKAQCEIELAAAEENERALRQRQEALIKQLETIDARKSASLQNSASDKARFQHLEERLQLFKESLALIQKHFEEDRLRRQTLQGEDEQLSQKEAQLRGEDEKLAANQNILEKKRREADLNVELIRREKEIAEAALDTLREEIQNQGQKSQEFQTRLHQIQMKALELGYQEKGIAERLQQTYKLNLQDFQAELYPLGEKTPEELAEEINGLKSRVESLGTVNLLAIEEYEELKQRYEFLTAQQNDLDLAKEQLLETIRKINRTTKSLFEQTLTEVQKYFQEYYELLFRGGQAKLVLLDETNPLESGIDIVVRPPGKKLQNISLLSGGEKALTAIALLFSLFKIKPSPFCVLDEVDAPLDEANIDRFLNVLATFLKSSQFIIVTHNRKTIAMGDTLYGVTMQEPGVSKLVSVKVSAPDNANLAPAKITKTEGPAVEENINA